jgi:hypothetical protein
MKTRKISSACIWEAIENTATSEVLHFIGIVIFPGKAVVSLPARDWRRIRELNNGYCPRRNTALVLV